MPRLRIASYPSLPPALARFGKPSFSSPHGVSLQKVDAPSAADVEELYRICRQSFAPTYNLGVCPDPFIPKAFFFDMDSTVIEQESIVELARAAGKAKEVSEITERAMAGELDFVAALQERLRLIAGTPSAVMEQVKSGLTLCVGMKDLAQSLNQARIPSFLVSGGFVPLAESISRQLGFRGYIANDLQVQKGRFTGAVVGSIVDGARKAQWVKEVCAKEKISLDSIVVVGDGANDLAMLRLAGMRVGYRPKPILYQDLHGCLGLGDHRFLGDLFFSAK